MAGVIASAGFASGDRVVVGHWWRSPLGAFTDVMWAAPDGTRTLFAPSEAVASFVTSVYAFDVVAVVPFRTASTAEAVTVDFVIAVCTSRAAEASPSRSAARPGSPDGSRRRSHGSPCRCGPTA